MPRIRQLLDARRLGGYLDAVTETWIGWSLPPAGAVLEQSGWRPDEAGSYCRRCGSSLGPGEATPSGCGSCRGQPLPGNGLVRLGSHAGALREWVLAIKYRGWAEMGAALGRRLGQAIVRCDLIDPDRSVIVPMPMPWQRRMYRGIDHARVIAAGVAEVLRVPIVPVLAKANGPPQVSLATSHRRRHGAGGLRIRRRLGGWGLNGSTVVLVDDVRTTGSSIRTACRLLRPLRAQSIVVAVVSVSDESARRDRAARMKRRGQWGPQDAALALRPSIARPEEAPAVAMAGPGAVV